MRARKPLNDERAIGLLREMLGIYSPSRQERELAEYLVAAMVERGFRAYCDGAGNAVGELGDGEREILLLGHIDTVPGFIPVRIEGQVIVDGRPAPAGTSVLVAGRRVRTNSRGRYQYRGEGCGAIYMHLMMDNAPPPIAVHLDGRQRYQVDLSHIPW